MFTAAPDLGAQSLDVPLSPPAASGTGRKPLDAIMIWHLGFSEIAALVGPETILRILELREWVASEGRTIGEPADLIGEVAERLSAVGVPVDRIGVSINTLHTDHDVVARIWVRGADYSERFYAHAGSQGYHRSPFKVAYETGECVELWLPETPDGRFDIVPDLRAQGFTHYLCVPVIFTTGGRSAATFATRAAAGFSDRDLAVLRGVMPAIAAMMEIRASWRTLDEVLRVYVGAGPRRAILDGNIKRGQVSTIRSAMLMADLRDSTAITEHFSAKQTVDLYNEFFDCLVPVIETHGGEVLKYLGDGLLAIFREYEEHDSDPAGRALFCARAALDDLARSNAEHGRKIPLTAGIALHYGTAAYGNVGSGQRLDFTVIGHDVNVVSRVAGLCRGLNETLLLTSAFVRRLGSPAHPLGQFALKGVTDPVEVLRPED
jgi:adenylate cyclase